MKKRTYRRFIAILLSVVLVFSTMITGLMVTASAQSTATGPLEDMSGALTLGNLSKLVKAFEDDNQLQLATSWVSGSASRVNSAAVNDPAGLFKKSGFTLSFSVKPDYVASENGDRSRGSAFFLGNSSSHFALNLSYNNNASAITTNNGTVLANLSKYIKPSEWHGITLVYDEASGSGMVSVYLDGEQVLAPTSVGFKVTDLETVEAYFGGSYGTGYMGVGLFDNICVEDAAMTTSQANEKSEELHNFALAKDDFKTLDVKTTVASGESFDLPNEVGGFAVTWTSDNSDVAVINGNTLTAKEVGDEAVEVTLTATLTYGDISVSKGIVISVTDAFSAVMDALVMPYAVTEETVLPNTIPGGTVTWESSDESVIAADGTITAPESGKGVNVDLTVTIDIDGAVGTKSFSLYVMPKDSEYAMSYIKSGNNSYTNSMHLALSEDKNTYTALNNNTGILYPRADMNEASPANDGAGVTKMLTSAYLFRMADGKVGVVANRIDANSSNANNVGKILFYTTEDLMKYEEDFYTLGAISLNTNLTVSSPQCEYNGSEYVITWKGSDGKLYQNTTSDFITISNPVEITGRYEPEVTGTAPSAAIPTNVLPVTKAEADGLRSKLMPLENTGVEEQDYSFTTDAGTALTEDDLTSTIEANYNDGGKESIPVTWDESSLSAVNYFESGVYTITGQAKLTEYPVVYGQADPDIQYYNGKYYYIATSEVEGQSSLYIRVGNTPLEALTASTNRLFSNDGLRRWAPEIHEIGGKLYILFALQVLSPWYTVQCHMMELKEGGDPTKIADWKTPVRVTRQDGSPLKIAEEVGAVNGQGITLDMTYFEDAGTHYVSWSQGTVNPSSGSSLYVATIDPENPTVLTSEPTVLSQNDRGWDRWHTNVREGGYVIKNGDNLYMTFSGDSVSDYYAVGLLTAKSGTDLTKAENWKDTVYPILTQESVSGERGPGHNAFTVDKDGRPLFVYHMKPNGGTRSASIRRVHFNGDGEPVLTMTPDVELKEEYRTVQGTIVVTDTGHSADELIVINDTNKLDLEGVTKDGDNYIVTGNITLPDTGNAGSSITWKSNNTSVVTDTERTNADYDNAPAGEVERQDTDTTVLLTATIKKGDEEATKVFTVIVKAKEEVDPYVGYLYAYFSGDETRGNDQQVYFAISEDGLTWSDLNENNPVLTSQLGDRTIRDPYIIRSHEGDKFYLIATDLNIDDSKYSTNGQRDWSKMSQQGSQAIIIWESTDLVNWTDHRRVVVSDDINAGSTWAPEAIYDEETGEYLVYWSSVVSDNNYQGYSIYVSKTRDFRTFTTPEVYANPQSTGTDGVIDASIYKEGDTYYRMLKSSERGYVFFQKADKLLSDTSDGNRGTHFETVSNSVLESYTGHYEGPTMFKFLDEEKWCMLVDEYGGSTRGYIPFVSTDLDAENSFSLMSNGTYIMPTGAKHGTVIPITQTEYDALTEKWAVKQTIPNQNAPILKYDFEETLENNTIVDKAGDNDAKTFGNATYRYDSEKQSNVLYLDGSTGTYAELPRGMFDGMNQMTISMDVKSELTGDFFFTFGIGQDTTKYMFLRTRHNQIRNAITTQSYGREYETLLSGQSNAYRNKWMKLTVVMDDHTMYLYVDGVLAQKNEYTRSIGDLGSNLISYLGKAFFNDPYFKGSYDNITVYNRALSADEINGIYPDKSELQALYDENIDKVEADYTAESWAVFEEALSKAEEVLADEYATETDIKGAYDALSAASEALEPALPPEQYLIGDVNGDGKISLKDVLTIQKYAAYMIELDDIQKFVADVNKDADVTLQDALLIQKWITKLITSDYINTMQTP